MKRYFLLLFAFLCSLPSFGATTVNATLIGPDGQPARFAFLQLDLKYCGYNVPATISGAVVLKSQRFKQSQLPATIFGNDEITCGNSYSTLWHVTAYADPNTPIAGDFDYIICSAGAGLTYCPNPSGSWDLSQASPFTGTTPPPGFQQIFGNPIVNQRITQPANTTFFWVGLGSGGNQGTVDFSGIRVVGIGAGSGTVTSITPSTGIESTASPITGVGTIRVANPLGSVVTVDGVDHTSQGGANSSTLCSSLAFINAHPGLYWTVVDNFPERGSAAWTKDPFNDATCGAGALGYKLKMGLGTWMTQWPSIFIPSSVEVELSGRASENQVNPANTTSGTLLIACANTSLSGVGGAPWTGGFAMGCPGATNFPGAPISTISRNTNVLTIVTTTAHNYTSAMASASPPVLVTIANTTGGATSCNGTFALAGVTNGTTITVAQTGANESCTVGTYSTVGSPLIALGNSGVGNNDFGAVLKGGTLSLAGIPGSVGITNVTCQERCFADQITIVGWGVFGVDIERPQAQNFDIGHLEILSGFKTGATIGTPPPAICINWEVNGPSRGFGDITCNPRGAATLAPILADVRLAGTQGGKFGTEHMENAQYQFIVTAAATTVVTRDALITVANTGSVLQGQNIATVSRTTNVVTITTAQDNAAITGEKVTIAGVADSSFNGTFSNIVRDSATQFHYAQTAANASSSGGTETLGGMATVHFCGTTSTINGCLTGGNTVRNIVMSTVRISPSQVVNALEDDTANAGVGRVIASGAWTGAYFQNPPEMGSALTPTNGGTGMIAPAAHSFIVAQGSSSFTALTSPTVNGFYTCGFNVIASAAVDPTCILQGVLPDPRTTTTETITAADRGGYVSFSNGGAIAVTLPQAGSSGFASNFFFVACDIGAGTATITPTTSTISFTTGAAYTAGSATMTLTTGQCAFIYSDNSNYFAMRR